jgi:cytochrome oxidase Cu insertion factor (SCO1/SenC/PrrC family)|tara:strand:+ start:2760 stop:3506 length:747 start_codon:yes stop_codon:yes gene_type:complete
MRTITTTLLLTASLLVSGCFAPESFVEESPYHGEAIDPVVAVDDFTLNNATGDVWNFAEQTEGKVVVIAFLFTNCIDICPIVTENLRWMSSQLSEEEHNATEFITVTVDPWRDDPATMLDWKEGRGTNWSHLSINDVDNESQMKAITDLWVNFGVGLWIEEVPSDLAEEESENESSNGSEGNSSEGTSEQSDTTTSARHHPDAYSVNHSTGTVLVDHRGLQQVWWGDNDWFPDLVLEDVQALINARNE